MPTIRCASKIDCLPCNDEPILNVSAETADVDRFISRFAFLNSIPPIRQYSDFDEQGGGIFLQIGCMRWCWSTISQADADDCARKQAIECAFNPLIPDVPMPDAFHPNRISLFSNQAVTGTYACPDGNLFSYTIAAGRIVALTPGTANAIAFALAKERARQHRVCISDMNDPICVDTWVTKQITASGPNVAVFPATDRWELVSGTIPNGMTLETGFTSDGITFSGIPTTIGQYSFRVRCTISTFGSPGFGDFMEKVFTVKIVGINETSPLPNATLGQAYSQQLHASGSTNPSGEIWSVTSGTPPPGLNLSPQGLWEGTPTGGLAGYSFTVQAQFPVGSTTAVCSKQFTITTTPPMTLAYWAFEDAAPSWDDSTGHGHTLIPITGPDSVSGVGIIANGAELLSQVVGNPTFVAVTIGDIPFTSDGWTVAGWFKLNLDRGANLGTIQINGGQSVANGMQIALTSIGFSGGNIQLNADANALAYHDAINVLGLPIGAFHFFVFWYDSATGIFSLQVDNGVVGITPSSYISPVPLNQDVFFQISGPFSLIATSRIADELGVWPKVLTAAQRTFLYNAGAARTWPATNI